MSRDKYISVVDMRSHLKRNYEKLHNDGDADAVSPSVDLPDDGVALPVSGDSSVDHEKLSRMPSLRKNTDSQIDRERRELEGKVIHDLAELENRLDDRFFRAGRSFIINLAEVRSVTRQEVRLSDGTAIPLPRGQYEPLNRAIISGIGG